MVCCLLSSVAFSDVLGRMLPQLNYISFLVWHAAVSKADARPSGSTTEYPHSHPAVFFRFRCDVYVHWILLSQLVNYTANLTEERDELNTSLEEAKKSLQREMATRIALESRGQMPQGRKVRLHSIDGFRSSLEPPRLLV